MIPYVAIVCGGRGTADDGHVMVKMNNLHARRPFTKIIHGGAKGVDSIVSRWCGLNPEVEEVCVPANWDKHGKSAGPIRNSEMLSMKPDVVIAFPGGRGTENMTTQARRAGVPVIFVMEPGNVRSESERKPPD